MRPRIIAASILAVAVVCTPHSVSAADSGGEGLSISPVRQQKSVTAGKSVSGQFTITNQTDSPMKIEYSVNQFAVKDYSYDFMFTAPPRYNWVKFLTPAPELSPNEKRSVYYVVEVPEDAPPGGHYFTLIAGTRIPGAGIKTSIQAGVLLYLTVEGELMRSSIIRNESLPFIVTGSSIPYGFDAENTGNVHHEVSLFGNVEGLGYSQPVSGSSHLLMPGTVRSLEGMIRSPILPGIYKVTYGYKTDFSSDTTTKTGHILFIPPWSLAALAFLILLGIMIMQRMRAKRKRE